MGERAARDAAGSLTVGLQWGGPGTWHLGAARSHPWSLIASSELLPPSQPESLPFPEPCPCLFARPPYLLQRFLLSLPFLPCRPTTVACNSIFFNTVSISRLNPGGAIVGSFHVSLLLSSIISSCEIPTHPTQPAHSLLCAGFLLRAI